VVRDLINGSTYW